MQQRSAFQATRNGERKAPQGCQDFFMNSEEQSRSIDEAGESSSARYPISAPNGRHEERPYDADSADFDVQQRPTVLHEQAGRISGKSTLPEMYWSRYLSPHSSENSAPSTSSSHDSSSESPVLRRAVTVEGDRAVFSETMQIATSAVRDLWTAEWGDVCGRPSLLVHKVSSGLPPYERA